MTKSNIQCRLAFMLLLLAGVKNVTAQQYDKVWVFGAPMSSMIFEPDSVRFQALADTTLSTLLTVGNICDSSGNLQFFTNGIKVYNAQSNIMLDGDSLSAPSEYYDQYFHQGMPSREGVVILPEPNNDHRYYIFHYAPTDTLLMNAGGYESLNLYYSIVDMHGDSGRGEIVSKNIPIIQNELLSYSRLSACKHANGRDWWIIKNSWHENIYYKFLLTPTGVQGPFIQQIGPFIPIEDEEPGFALFNPTGTKYVTFGGEGYIIVMDFNRCTGLFSNPDSIYNNASRDPIHHPSAGASAAAFSPSGRLLYINNTAELNQYDLSAPHINDSVRLVSFLDSTDFYHMNLMQLGADSKIYISTLNGGTQKMHVINEPDSFGFACDIRLYGIQTNCLNSINLPYFPNYKLGALAGACDTISTSISHIATVHPAFAQLAPNPATAHTVLFYYSGQNTANKADMYDVTDRLVWSADVNGSHGTIDIDLSHMASGMYVVTFVVDGKPLLNTKLVVTK